MADDYGVGAALKMLFIGGILIGALAVGALWLVWPYLPTVTW